MVGRTIKNYEVFHNAGQLKSIKCQLWRKDEVRSIALTWVADNQKQAIAKALTEGWPAKQETFSLYLLRTLVEYVDNLERKPSALLRKAVVNQLSSSIAPVLEPQKP